MEGVLYECAVHLSQDASFGVQELFLHGLLLGHEFSSPTEEFVDFHLQVVVGIADFLQSVGDGIKESALLLVIAWIE